jgi:periplasmic protein CpxP/Spy
MWYENGVAAHADGASNVRKICLQSDHDMRVLVMKLHTRCGVLVIALASLGIAGSALAAQPATTTTTTPTGRPHGHFHRGGPGGALLGTLLRATKQLNLSSDQQTQIKSILSSARSQARSQGGAGTGPDITVLGNPADPNYATALQSAKTAASNRIQQESELQSQVYNVLTTAQRAQLPSVLATMKAQMASWRAQHTSVAPN